MALIFPGMYSSGYWVEGSEELHDQIIITSKGQIKRNGRWVGGYLPGIY